jgi:iron complex outermembrane receptor protein
MKTTGEAKKVIRKTSRFRNNLRSKVSARALVFGMAASVAIGPVAYAQSVPNTSANSSINLDLGSVLATGTATNDGDPNIAGTAANEAPARASLKETQPTSVISSKFVQNTMVPTVNYSDIMNISPSASSTDQSGPGLDESKHVEMRGFQDGQYNVTFDGVPYGDSNDFTHHTTTFFMANDVGETIVDRGPGTASTSGNATFGGTVAIVSKDPLPTRTMTAYGTYGSYATYVGGAEADTGSFMDGTAGFVDGEYAGSDTYNTNAKLERSNVFAKLVKPLGSHFVLTAVAMYNDTYQQYAEGGTLGQIAEYGPQFGLSDNPLSQNYKDYQTDHYKTDFEYIDLRGTFGDGWTIDSKLYTYAYYHHSLNGIDPLDCGDGETACVALNTTDLSKKNLAGATDTTNASGLVVPGQFKFNTYRSVGTISRVQKDFDIGHISGDVKFGAWYDHQVNTRALIDENLVTAVNLLPAPGSTEPIERLMHDTLDTFQPYAQLDLKPIEGLTISPGVKWNYFKRGINAPVNQKTLLPLGYEKDYTKLAPSVTANYAVTPNTSVYVQYAVGFLAPNLNVLYSTKPAESNLQPETTNNYQVGTVYQSADFAGDADAYYIPFNNLASSRKVNGVTIFSNVGGATYEGLEAEGTYVLGGGWNVYANGSVNSANYNGSKGHDHVAETPQATAALGFIYDDGHWNGSVTDKWVGGKYGVDSPDQYWYDPYNIVNASAGVDIKRAPGIPAMKVTLDLENITGQTQIYDYSETTGNGTLVDYTLPGRSVFLDLRVPIAF